MSATNETGADETSNHSAQPESATGETLILTVDEAAELLAISPQAVRKRIKAGTLPARRDGRVWQVFVERATNETTLDETPRNRTQLSTKPLAQPAQLQATQLAALVEPFTTPLVERIEALSREAERERVRADAAAKDVELLQIEIDRLRHEPSSRPDPPSDQPQAQGEAIAPDRGSDTLRSETATTWRWWEFWKGEWH